MKIYAGFQAKSGLVLGIAILISTAGTEAIARSAPSETVSPAAARTEGRIRVARTSGIWVVEKGDSLLRVCRYLATDSDSRRKLSEVIKQDNPGAFLNGDRARLVLGAKLRLRSNLLSAPSPATGAAIGPASTPFAPVAAAGNSGAGPQAPVTASTTPRNGKGNANGSAASRPTASAPETPGYRDQLIGGLEIEPEEAATRIPRDLSPGLRSWAVDYRVDYRNSAASARSTAQGVAMLHRRETEQYGDFSLDAQLGYLDGGTIGAPSAGRSSKVTLYHDRFALAQGVTASSELGVTRTNMTPWLANSYRVFLPTSLMSGFATTVETPGARWNASIGQIGRVAGLNVQGFERTTGDTATFGASTTAIPGWLLAANAVALRNNREIPDNGAVTVGAEYRGSSVGPIRLQGVIDDARHKGFWADGQWRDGRFANRLGAYQIDPDTRFGEGFLNNDVRSAYFRSEFRRGFDFAAVGLEVTENNLDRRPDRGGESSAGGSGNVTLRLDRSMSVGGAFSVRRGLPRVGGGDATWSGSTNVFLSRSGELGFSRMDLNVSGVRPGDARGNQLVRSVSWNQGWPRWRDIQFNTLATLTDERSVERTLRRAVVSAAASAPLAQDLQWDASVTGARVDDGEAIERNYNATIGLNWTVSRNWYLHLQWYRTQIQTASSVTPDIPFVRENQVQLVARYEESYGTPYPRVAGPGGRSGTGSVSGTVFFDENGDGIRQATERGVPGIAVYLDRRQTQVTDREGRFNFALVPSGARSITIALDRVPLPWGLADESPHAVEVPVRGDGRIDIGLTRVAP